MTVNSQAANIQNNFQHFSVVCVVYLILVFKNLVIHTTLNEPIQLIR